MKEMIKFIESEISYLQHAQEQVLLSGDSNRWARWVTSYDKINALEIVLDKARALNT
jgi:hypothetical protein